MKTDRPWPPQGGVRARHLLGVADLERAEIDYVLALAEYYAGFLKRGERPEQRLSGKTQVNVFFEDSTRTNMSFELAGKKLGADVLNVPVKASSVNKGEEDLDTAQTLAAMGAHALVVRHGDSAVLRAIADAVPCAVINAGDGVNEHPTQALLDAATIRSALGRIEGTTIAIVGDVRHSRVAGSAARLFPRLGAMVRFVGPRELRPADPALAEVAHFDSLAEGLSGADIVMALRLQFERGARIDVNAYRARFQLNRETLKLARAGAFVMHPGPMNRGLEIDGALADDRERSLILRQVFYGVATRMAALDALVTGGVT